MTRAYTSFLLYTHIQNTQHCTTTRKARVCSDFCSDSSLRFTAGAVSTSGPSTVPQGDPADAMDALIERIKVCWRDACENAWDGDTAWTNYVDRPLDSLLTPHAAHYRAGCAAILKSPQRLRVASRGPSQQRWCAPWTS